MRNSLNSVVRNNSDLFVKARYIKTSTGYVKLYLSDGRVVDEHRFIMEQHLGRKLVYNEVVHHNDGNKQNNVVSNLSVRSRAKHAAAHQSPCPVLVLTCPFCGASFVRAESNVRCKRKLGQRAFYCSRSCGVSGSKAYASKVQNENKR